jgi:hypothetical protein
LHPAAARGAWFFKCWFAIGEGHDARKAGRCRERRQHFRLVLRE